MREAIVWVSNNTGWGYAEIMSMPLIKLMDWYDNIKLYHEERLNELQSTISSVIPNQHQYDRRGFI